MKKTKVLILGGTGMLGSAVGQYFQSQSDRYDVTLTYRAGSESQIYGAKTQWMEFDPMVQSWDFEVFGFDYIINCIGIIKPMMSKSITRAITINSLFPHSLSELNKSSKVIHISTDCVYSGHKGSYVESDLHDCLDAYGKSKSLGEPTDKAMVIRTSIIGPEIHNNSSLIAWAQSQAGKSVNGFRNHLWNGVTTKQFGKVCDQVISKDLYKIGLFHVHSNVVNKFELLNMINDKYNLGLKISEIDAAEAVDRSMATEKGLLSELDIPPLREQIMDM